MELNAPNYSLAEVRQRSLNWFKRYTENPVRLIERMSRGKRFDYLVTLTFQGPRVRNSVTQTMDLQNLNGFQLERAIWYFSNILRKKLYGRGESRMNIIPIIHTNTVQPHAHILMSEPDQNSRYKGDVPLENLIRECWKKIKIAGKIIDFKPLREEQDFEGYVFSTSDQVLNYMMKEINAWNANYDNVCFESFNLVKN
jgi:hypothetical protein